MANARFDMEEAVLDINALIENNDSDNESSSEESNSTDAEIGDNDSSSDDDDNDDYPERLTIDPSDGRVNFPERRTDYNTEQRRIILDCSYALNSGRNSFVEHPPDKQRRMALLTSVLLHQQNSLNQLNDQQVPCGNTSHSSSASCKTFLAARSLQEMEDIISILKKFKNTGYLQNINVAVLAKPSQLCNSCHDVYLCDFDGTADYRFIEETGTFHSIRHLRKKGSSLKFCPYRYTTETLLPKATLIIGLQEFTICPISRAKFNITNNTTTIFEDGGNIENSCYAQASSAITTKRLQSAGDCLQSLADCFDEAEENIEGKEEMTQCLDKLSGCLRSFATAINVRAREAVPVTKDNLLQILRSNGFGQLNIKEYMLRIRCTIACLQNYEVIKRFAQQNYMDDVKLLVTVQQFLSSLNYVHKSIAKNNKNDFDLEISKYVSPGEEPANTFKISYVNLAAILEPIYNAGSSVIISSACLPPISILREQLSSSTFEIEADEVLIEDQDQTSCFFAYCSKGPNGTQFRLNYQNRDNETFIDETGEAILKVVQAIPEGIVVFFPSVPALEKKIECWKRRENRLKSVWEEISEIKHVFSELDFRKADEAKRNLQIFRNFCTNPEGDKNGAIMFALHRERVNELMDFQQGEVRCFVSLGIPYHSIKAFCITTKEAYILSKHPSKKSLGERNNKLWYNAEAFHNQNQKFTHCLRKGQDWFIGLILDERMSDKVNSKVTDLLLPRWMQGKWKEFGHFEKLRRKLDDFICEQGVAYN